MLGLLYLPLLGLLALVIVMIAAWARQRTTRNAGVVDVIWTASIGALALVYAGLAGGWLPRRLLVAVLVGAWSLRLTLHLARRVGSEAEDGRYRAMRTSMGEGIDRFLFWFFQAQALLAVLLSLVFLVLCAASDAGWRATDALAVLLWVTALVGESIADRQLARWRSDPANRGRTCRAGLWRYSRHPNYFFEWLNWLVYPLLGIGLPYGWSLWLAPAAMLLFVLKVTGIPPTEEQALKSRGDDYREYQRTTNAFFPGPPRAQTVERSLETR
ncbi:MAG: DUF1295 domain-containing protein [Planctomycetota bacterium]